MNLSDYEFFPGSIIDVADPKYLGRVKANVPTVFDPSMDKDGLPWIYPFTMGGNQSFSKMREGSKIWVIKNKKNYNEFWYIPMFELNQDTRALIGSDDNYENGDVVLSRNMGSVSVYIYYNDTDGIVIKYGDNNFITINTNSEVILQAGNGKIKISGDHVYLGDGEKGEPAVMGNVLKNMLSNLSNQLAAASSAATTLYPPNPSLVKALRSASSAISPGSDLLANNTNVD